MRSKIGLIFLALAHLGSTAVLKAAAEECGNLGIMDILEPDLPLGVAMSDVRRCAGHPLGHKKPSGGSLAPNSDRIDLDERDVFKLDEQKCFYDAQYGCSGGYCWKHCGPKKDDGKWCWTALKAGLGAWIKCKTWADCGTTTYACGRGCARCGCGC